MIKKLSTIAGSVAIGSIVALAPFAAFAQTNPSNASTAGVNPGTIMKVLPGFPGNPSNGKDLKARGDSEITQRITSLNQLMATINGMKNVPANAKASIDATINTEISNLTALKAKIDADDAATIATDVASITKDYRVYMLVVPQENLTASVDAAGTVASSMQQLSVILQSRISEAQAAGKDMTAALAALSDMNAKVADANTKSAAALAETANLKPDQGDASIQASNKAALTDALSKMKAVYADFQAARADITIIENAIKGTGSPSTATTTAQ